MSYFKDIHGTEKRITGDGNTINVTGFHNYIEIHLSHDFLCRIETIQSNLNKITTSITQINSRLSKIEEDILYLPGGPVYKKAKDEFNDLTNKNN